MFSLAFALMVLHISTYSIRCLSSPFSTIPRRFIARARVGDDILDFSGWLIILATHDALCWIMYVMVSLMVFEFNHLLSFCMESTLGDLMVINSFLSSSTSNLMFLMAILWSLPMLRLWRCMACLLGRSQFLTSLHPLGFSTSISSQLSSETWYSLFCTFLMWPIRPRCRLFRFSIRAQMCPLPLRFVLFLARVLILEVVDTSCYFW